MRATILCLFSALPLLAQSAPGNDPYPAAEENARRIMRNAPTDFEAIRAAVTEACRLAAGGPHAEESARLVEAETTHKRTEERRAVVLSELDTILPDYQEKGDSEAAWKRIMEVDALLRVRRAPRNTEDAWQHLMIEMWEVAIRRGQALKALDPPDWKGAAFAFRIVGYALRFVPPEIVSPEEAQPILKLAAEAVDKLYFETDFPDSVPWEDLGKRKWLQDECLRASESDDGLELAYMEGKPSAALRWLNESVRWEDFVVRLEFTLHQGTFQLMARTQPEQPPGATFDTDVLLTQEFVKPGARATVEYWVYDACFRCAVDGKMQRPGFCAPTAPKRGGVCFRIPMGTRLTLHTIQIRVLLDSR